MNARTYIQAKVVRNLPLGPGIYHLVVDTLGQIEKAAPGQFVMVRPTESFDPLLARPFSIHDLDPPHLDILYRVVGRGTRLMAGLAPGQPVSIMGPLGRGFDLADEKVILLAGGIGAAPFLLLAKRLAAKGSSPRIIYGAKTAQELVRAEEIREFSSGTVEVTEDGTAGQKGLATEYLEGEIAKNDIQVVYGCGPGPMLKKAHEITRRLGLRFFVSLEEVMGCGMGVCLGCAVPRSNGGYLHLCRDGPVVDASEVAW